ncbi:MAG: hypothetical protein NVSMB2_19520 [Chloroflexota bacterium]
MQQKENDRSVSLLVGYRYFPHHLQGLVALLLFFIALVLGAAVAMFVRTVAA